MTIEFRPIPEGSELIVVFENTIEEAKAAEIVKSWPYSAHPGGDSSRGKLYFDAHGPQYVLEVKPEDQPVVIEQLTHLPEVFEVYKADRSIVKD